MKNLLRNAVLRVSLGIAVFALTPRFAHSQDAPLPYKAPSQPALTDPLTKEVNISQRNRAFTRIWEQRFKRDISAEIVPYLDDPNQELAQRAIRALGRLENPAFLPELQKRRDAQVAAIEAGETDRSKRPKNYFDFDTAIARIQSRDLHGREKIEFVLAHMEGMKPAWTWDEAVRISKEMKKPLASLNTPDPVWFERIHRFLEVLDMLYSMSSNGEDIEELRGAFLFSKPQNVQLDGAKLPLEQQIQRLLDASHEVDIVGDDEEYVYESFLLSLGEPARVALKKRVEQVLRDKPKFTHKFPITCMLHAAAKTGDLSYVPLFDRYQKEMTYIPYAQHYASDSRQMLQLGLAFPSAPQ